MEYAIKAGNMNDYESLSQFDTLEAFNEHYRKLTYTFAELLDQKPTFKSIISTLFKLAAKTKGVAFPTRQTLAKLAGCSLRSVDNFIKDASTFGIKIEKAHGRKGKRFGGYAHNVFVFGPVEGLLELPSKKKSDSFSDNDCDASCKPSLQPVEEVGSLEPQAIEAENNLPKQDSFNQDFPTELNNNNSNSNKENNSVSEVEKEINIEEQARIHRLPIDLLHKLKPYIGIEESIKVAKGIRGAIRKLGKKLDDVMDFVIAAIDRAVYKQKQGTIKTTFGACVVGILKGIIADEQKELREFFTPILRVAKEKEMIRRIKRNAGIRSKFEEYKRHTSEIEAFEMIVQELRLEGVFNARTLVVQAIGYEPQEDECLVY